jgi:hypothetical protein
MAQNPGDPDIQTDEDGNVTILAPTVVVNAQAPQPGGEEED